MRKGFLIWFYLILAVLGFMFTFTTYSGYKQLVSVNYDYFLTHKLELYQGYLTLGGLMFISVSSLVLSFLLKGKLKSLFLAKFLLVVLSLGALVSIWLMAVQPWLEYITNPRSGKFEGLGGLALIMGPMISVIPLGILIVNYLAFKWLSGNKTALEQ